MAEHILFDADTSRRISLDSLYSRKASTSSLRAVTSSVGVDAGSEGRTKAV